MNRSDLIEAIVKATDISKTKSDEALSAVLSAITGALKKGDDVSLVGFGSFKVSKRAARAGRNPSTGEPIKIAASKVVRFSAGKTLKDTVNAKKAAKK